MCPDRDDTDDESPHGILLRPSENRIQGVENGITPTVVRQISREINEPIITRLDWLSTHITINVEVLDNIVTRLESMQSAQKSHQLETEPTLDVDYALRVDVNSLMERISSRVADARQQPTAERSTKQEEIPCSDDGNRNTTVELSRTNTELTALNPGNLAHHVSSSCGVLPLWDYTSLYACPTPQRTPIEKIQDSRNPSP